MKGGPEEKIVFILLALMLCCLPVLHAQVVVEGVVLDAADRQPLAFVNIAAEGRPGTSTNIDGRFRIELPSAGSLTFSYVGYKLLRQHFSSSAKNAEVLIEKSAYDLGEIEVLAGENPAHRIIKLAVQNRDRNNPEKISSYRCLTYTKTICDLLSPSGPAAVTAPKDSLAKDFDVFADSSHLLLMESVTERKYLHPGNLNEKVLATKVSGFKQPSFTTTATDLQPFSFYGDYFKMLDKDFLNPISPGSTNKYFFILEDTLFQDKDSVFLISYRPRKGKNFDALEGVLYINSNGYAIQNVIASPAEKSLMDIKVRQQYTLVGGTQWFPEQLMYELSYDKFPTPSSGIKLSGKSFVKDVILGEKYRKSDFDFTAVTMEPEAAIRNEQFWTVNRADTLSTRERSTYRIVDSLGKEMHLDQTLRILESLSTFQLPVSIFNIDINRILHLNDYENVRIGAGLHTNDRLSRWFSAGGYFGYGFQDSVVKYGGVVKLFLKKNSKQYFLSYAYSKDISEPARSQYFYTRNNINRNIITYRMDFLRQQEIAAGFRVFKYLTATVALNQSVRKPLYNYLFHSAQEDYTAVSAEFRSTELRIKGRYAYQERLVQALGQLLSEGSKYPVLYFAYTKGFRVAEKGMYDYSKVSAGIEKEFLLRHIGKTKLLLEGGYVEDKVPYPFLFNGNGSFTKGGYLFVENTFQTMEMYEFLSDRYVNLFLTHRFPAPLFVRPKMRPEVTIVTAAAVGDLADPGRHQNLQFKTMQKGYFESGAFVNNIFRINYANLVYLGLGGGVFLRYGPYAYEEPPKNLAYKISFSFSF